MQLMHLKTNGGCHGPKHCATVDADSVATSLRAAIELLHSGEMVILDCTVDITRRRRKKI